MFSFCPKRKILNHTAVSFAPRAKARDKQDGIEIEIGTILRALFFKNFLANIIHHEVTQLQLYSANICLIYFSTSDRQCPTEHCSLIYVNSSCLIMQKFELKIFYVQAQNVTILQIVCSNWPTSFPTYEF